MNELLNSIVNTIKLYAKENNQNEVETLSSVIGYLISISALSYVEPIIIDRTKGN